MSAPIEQAQQADAQESRAVVLKFLEVFSSGELEPMLDMLADDATWWVLGTIPDVSGVHTKAEFGAMHAGIADDFKDATVKLEPKGITAEGDRVACEAESHGVRHDGRVYHNQYHFLFRVRDGKIASVREYLDTEHTREFAIG